MQAFTIQIPKGTKLQDRHGDSEETIGVNLNLVAVDHKNALLLGSVIYATRINDDPITTFNTAPPNETSTDFVEVLARAIDISGTINIEGGVLLERHTGASALEVFIKASEAGKARWLRLLDQSGEITPWRVVTELQKIF
jgi:hypothetical protein